MNISKTLGVVLLAGIPLSQAGCSKQEEDPNQTRALVNYSYGNRKNIHLFDRDKNEVLDTKEMFDYINVAIDNGDGLLTYPEFCEAAHRFANLDSKDGTHWQLYSEVAQELTEPYIKQSIPLKEGNLSRQKIESVLKELIEIEKLNVSKEQIDFTVKAKALQGESFKYLENDAKFRQATEANLLRQKAVDFLMDNPIWIEKLFK